MLAAWVSGLAPSVRLSLGLVLLAVLAAYTIGAAAKFQAGRHGSTDEAEFDDKLCSIFWGFKPQSSLDASATQRRFKWAQLGCYVVAYLGVVGAVVSFSPTVGGITVFVATLSMGQALWTEWQRSDPNKEPESAEKLPGGSKGKLAVSIVTGFLGAGKTTLVNHILHNTAGKHLLVIENEVGEIAVDNQLLVQALDDTAEIITLNNGCICCKVRKDLLMTIKTVLKSDQHSMIDHVVIESTGVADPAPIIQMFYMDSELRARCRLDAVITMVDCKHVLQHLQDKGQECARQIGFADKILLNKSDLVTEEQLRTVQAACCAINSSCSFTRCVKGEVPVEQLLCLEAFEPDKAEQLARLMPAPGGHSVFGTVSLQFRLPFALGRFNRALGKLLAEQGQHIFRAKGILSIQGDDRRFVFQGVHMVLDGHPGAPWEQAKRHSVLVFIGRGLDKAQLTERFEACLAVEPEAMVCGECQEQPPGLPIKLPGLPIKELDSSKLPGLPIKELDSSKA